MSEINTNVAFAIVKAKHPASGKQIGERMVVSYINRAAYDVFSGEYIQSHAPKYRLRESGDYRQVTREIRERWIKRAEEELHVTVQG